MKKPEILKLPVHGSHKGRFGRIFMSGANSEKLSNKRHNFFCDKNKKNQFKIRLFS